MALQTQNSLLQREKRILVAIEVAARKMEMLSMISTLCHHFSAATSPFNRNQGCCWLDQLKSVLGREAVEMLQEFVSCQKSEAMNEMKNGGHILVHQKDFQDKSYVNTVVFSIECLTTKMVYSMTIVYNLGKTRQLHCNEYYGPSHPQKVHVHELRKTMTREEFKKDLIGRLKQAPDKRKYLKEVMMRTKLILNELNAKSHSDTAKTTQPTYSSVLNLLRAALNSKYRPHVRRCFRELDLESLMSILYLILHVPTPSASAEQLLVSSEKYSDDWRTELSPRSSVTLKDPMMGHASDYPYYAQSPATSLSLSWDDEETVVNLIEQLEDTPSHSFHETPKETAISEFDKEEADSKTICIPEIKEKQSVTDIMIPPSTSSFIVTSMKGYLDYVKVQDLPYGLKYDLTEKDVVELYEKLVNTISNLSLESITTLLMAHEDECTNRMHTGISSEVQKLSETFHAFHLLVENMFTQHKNTDTLSLQTDNLNTLTIELEILSIEENKMKKNLNQVMSAHKSLVESLHAKILEWKCQVEDVQQNLGQQHKNIVKNHVAAELSIEKDRKHELSTFKLNLNTVNDSLSRTTTFVRQTVKSLRARRHYLEASLESLMRQYDATMLKYQVKIDERSVEEAINNKAIEKLQNKFKNVEEMYDEMRAMKRLKQLLQNMEKAEAIKQNWAARKIQVAWRKYKVAKLRKKKLKGRKKGKKKTPPPGKGTSPPTKASTPGSRSKSQTP